MIQGMSHYMISVLTSVVVLALAPLVQADEPVSRAALVASVESVAPGQTITLGLQFTMIEDWHTYTEEPGDSGMPPDITVRSPQGLRTGAWRYPPAQTFTDAAGTTYGYEDEVILLSRMHVPAQVPDGSTVTLEMEVTWLVCKDICISLSDTLRLEIPVRSDGGVQRPDWEARLARGGWSVSDDTETGAETP